MLKHQNTNKMKTSCYLAIIVGICLFSSCRQSQERAVFNREALLYHYTLPEDSLKKQAISFIINNISTHYSDIPVFTNRLTGREMSLDLTAIENKSILLQIIEQHHLDISFRSVPDTTIVSNTFLLQDLEQAFRLWNKYPWADQVPFEIFLNYLLPYKVHGEKPADWRTFFINKFKPYIQALLHNNDLEISLQCTNDIYYHFIVYFLWQWFEYTSTPTLLTRYPSFDELMVMQSGDCYGGAYLNVMALRSLGIPTALDFVPMWGRRNAGHYSEVFWDNEQRRFRTASGREFRFPAKVFRYTFRQQNNWSAFIQPVVQHNPFLLDFLKHDHWMDVTHEHTVTATVEYEWEFTSDFAYICVLNYGRWMPIFWGKVEDGKARFENMGTDMLYRIAVPFGASYKPISSIFHVDETGSKTFFKPNPNERINLRLSRLNTGARSWIRAGRNYSLFYYDGNGDWNLFDIQQAESDSLIVFENVPSNTLYWLWNIESDRRYRRLERPFLYENGVQIFY